jgi:anti-anti-sigma factor
MPNREQPFRAAVRPVGSTAVIDLSGEINGRADETLEAAYAQAQALRPESVLLNFTAVDYINSTGIALIVGLLAQARRDRIRLLTCGLGDHYEEIFRITRLADFMTIYRDEAAALAQPAAAE